MTEKSEQPASGPASQTEFPRRNFFKRALAVVIGGVISLFPAVVGVFAFFDPLRKRDGKMPGEDKPKPAGVPEGFIEVAPADAVPADGTPQFFRVIADRMDGWTYFPDEPIGSIYLRKEKDGSFIAYNTTCPHAGCAVDYRSAEKNFYCPCHNSAFTLEGERSPTSPSARDLDTLETKVVSGSVWVKYVDYRTGHAEKIEVS